VKSRSTIEEERGAGALPPAFSRRRRAEGDVARGGFAAGWNDSSELNDAGCAGKGIEIKSKIKIKMKIKLCIGHYTPAAG